jgi:Spy/CpxP family protein refolding chaperone
MQKLFLTLSLLVFATLCFAQQPADSTTSPLKTMSYEQYKAYAAGLDINKQDAVAELNNYPSVRKVLNLKKELALTTEQVAQLNTINAELKRKMKEMGAFIIKNETTLNELFRTKQINDGSLIFYTNRAGLYIGELRNAMLQTYLKVQNILTAEQLKKYQQIHKA